MSGSRRLTVVAVFFASLLGAVVMPIRVAAHCDALDGPVVGAAREAITKGDPRLVLVWVRDQDAEEVRRAFDRTLAIRGLSAGAQELADMYFFETVVRVHRAGEGAPYSGLKPAGRDLGPAIPAADEALRSGDPAPLVKLLTDETRAGLLKTYEAALHAKKYPASDVNAGREFVHAYVEFVHFVERAHAAVASAAESHAQEEHEH